MEETSTGRSPEPTHWCDSSSEVSDEGYKSQGAVPRPSPRTRRHGPRKLSIGDANHIGMLSTFSNRLYIVYIVLLVLSLICSISKNSFSSFIINGKLIICMSGDRTCRPLQENEVILT